MHNVFLTLLVDEQSFFMHQSKKMLSIMDIKASDLNLFSIWFCIAHLIKTAVNIR